MPRELMQAYGYCRVILNYETVFFAPGEILFNLKKNIVDACFK
jgi:hypothetical protein